MKTLTGCLLLALLPLTVSAQGLDAFRWKTRLLFVFTPDDSDPVFRQQYALLQQAMEELKQRRLLIMLVNPEGDQENTGRFLQRSDSEYYYDYFGVQPYQMELLLVGLDGEEKYRAKNTLTPVSILLELIDGMPMRQQEIREGFGNESQIGREESSLPNGGG